MALISSRSLAWGFVKESGLEEARPSEKGTVLYAACNLRLCRGIKVTIHIK